MIKPSDSKLDLGFFTTMQRSFLASDDQPNSMWYLKELKVCITFYVYACVHLLTTMHSNQKLVD